MNKNHHVFVLLIVGLFFIGSLCVGSVSAATGLQVTLTSNPVVVAPGTHGYIELNLKSVGAATSGIDISASSWDPGVVMAQGNWDSYVGTLDSGESYSVLYEYRISGSASPGLYQVLFEVDHSSGHDIRQTALIRVEDATVLDITSMTPSSIRVGEATTLVFNISNNCGIDMENILFTWEDPNDLILPVGADNRVTIASIGAENYTKVPIVVMASSGISPGVYPLAITMDFYDQAGTVQTITSTVGMQISGTTTFDVVLQTSTTSTTTFAIVNTGANTASSVVVSIPQQPGYTTSGTSSSSIGNLDAGDYTLASFSISSTTSNTTMTFPSFNRTGMDGTPPSGNFTGGRNTFMNRSFMGLEASGLLVQISYTDVFGVRQTIQQQVNLSSGSASGFSSRTGALSNSGTFPGGFTGQSQSSDSTNSIVYITIGVVGIIVIVALIQLGRKKKLSKLSKLFKGRKE